VELTPLATFREGMIFKFNVPFYTLSCSLERASAHICYTHVAFIAG